VRRSLRVLGLAVVLSSCQVSVGPARSPSITPQPSGLNAPRVALAAVTTRLPTPTPTEAPPRARGAEPTATPTPRPKATPKPAPAVASSATIIPHVPQYYQLPMSCEETSLSMALVHQGLNVSTKQILKVLGVDNTPITLTADGRHIATWGDPDEAFVGDVYGFAYKAPWGFFAYPKALVRVIQHFGGSIVAWSEPGVGPDVITASDIYRYIAAGHPVVAYATWDWRRHPVYYYTDQHGNRVPNIYPAFGHVYALYGVSTTSVLLRDPFNGTYWVSKKVFGASYELGMAIVLK